MQNTKRKKQKKLIILVLGTMLMAVIFLFCGPYYDRHRQKSPMTFQMKNEFTIQGLTWRTIAYYYHRGIYGEIYNRPDNLRIIEKVKNIGANYLLVRAFYSGTADGRLIGNDMEAKQSLKEAIVMAHKHGIKILLTPFVESRDYWHKKWVLSPPVWSDKVISWAKFAEKNNVEMFAPGIEMNLILDEKKAGEWYKKILPKIRNIYHGKIITAEHYDIERWKILDNAGSFAGYDCIGLTVFPRKKYNGTNDIGNLDDYREYVEKEAKIIDMLAKKYNIPCKLAVPLGLDYWQGSRQRKPVPDAAIVAQATQNGLDIFKNHQFTGIFISHWASEPDHFPQRPEVEIMLKNRWTKIK